MLTARCSRCKLLSKERIFADHCKWLHESLLFVAKVCKCLLQKTVQTRCVHCRVDRDTLLRMISEKRKDPKLLVDMAKICAEIGLAPNHWLLCKAQIEFGTCWPDTIEAKPPALLVQVHHMQACFFAQAGEASRAVETRSCRYGQAGITEAFKPFAEPMCSFRASCSLADAEIWRKKKAFSCCPTGETVNARGNPLL